MAWYYIAV